MTGMVRSQLAALATWTPVVAVAVLSQLGIGLESPWSGSDTGLAVVSALLAVPLLIRATRPVATAATVAATLVLQVELGGSLHFASFIAVLVASYALGRHGAGRHTVAGVVVLLLGVVLSVRHSLPQDADELVFPLFYVTAACALGSVVRRQVRQSAELRRLNEALLRERDALDRLVLATERLRLARELHDVVAHTLTVAVIQAEACEDALEDDVERARTAAQQVQSAGRRGLADLRSMVRMLRDDEERAGQPTLKDLDALASVMAGAGLTVTVLPETLGDVPADVEHALYRICQEALTNVVKHSAATTATVRVRRRAGGIELEVVDDGPGVVASDRPGGHGLLGMGERVAPFGGHVSAGPDRGGFRVHATVPVLEEVRA